MKIRRCMADFHGGLSITFGPSDLILSQLIQELTCGQNRDIPIRSLFFGRSMVHFSFNIQSMIGI